ncbi:bifunctional hydroxymethylpyrimidine kinase/phosphomethylpyrimidine kinase [Bacillus mojavensis]|uniref:bifunctional hydroxymethylpyrimidine kinase/phosphomethylpyrimidine kinase n=1 Tax=Bacillus mojavensis TaxID=72360 RepID=UPI002DB8AC85|nr:bifunctional hydroxymethylpyrimidine kinase/phosphomethylpyrimidine kinase [Bacillus mojavensis]MEC1682774.1 bifunctional hydroxymethylpyrimidine kinase/phosphomethylpyrimidine kinase [Bacillus mojavensis]MEC1707162.1 bifunctional hydroxymethylpyrimidine kinase/phosphomethylpyrimidine kinase [Bacillus mojavensis]
MSIYKTLTIAGSDSGGGAGIQADIKTFQELGVFGMSAITAVTAQNTLGVHGVYPLTAEALREQIDAVAEDLRPDAVKTGMLWNAEMIEEVARKIDQYELSRVIVDPVMIAKGGASLLRDESIATLKELLIPRSYAITPNVPEAEALTGMVIRSLDDRKKAAEQLVKMGAQHVIIKGGHQPEDNHITDLLFDGNMFMQISHPYIDTKHTHGTGCTFAAALTAQTAKGDSIHQAFEVAANFVREAVENTLGIGSGHGPTNHFAFKRNSIKINR